MRDAAGGGSGSRARGWDGLRRVLLPALGVLAVLVPFLFWRGTWFGRPLTDEEISRQLADAERPRRVQHALSQIADRIVAGDARGVDRWYPEVDRLARHPVREVRLTAAWVLGQDPSREQARPILASLLEDPEPMVRRNAALALVRFGDDRGRGEILRMLSSDTVASPAAGRARLRLAIDSPVNPGTLVARIETEGGGEVEVRSPVPGRIESRLVEDGALVRAGDALLRVQPSEDERWEALRALYLIGRAEDLGAIERVARGAGGESERVKRQATLTADAIRRRAP